MTAMTIAIKTLLAGSGVTELVGQRIYPVFAPQAAALPNIIVHRISDNEEVLLQGASQFPEARISIECRATGADGAKSADMIGEAVVNWLRDKHLYSIDGAVATFRRTGTDETDASEQADQGVPSSTRRIIDFYVRYRAA